MWEVITYYLPPQQPPALPFVNPKLISFIYFEWHHASSFCRKRSVVDILPHVISRRRRMKNTGNPNSPQLEDAEAVCSLPCSSFQKTVDLQSSSPSSSAVFLKNNLDSPWGLLKKRHKDLLINQCCPKKKKKMLVSKTVSLFQEKRKNLIVSKLFPRALEAPVTISTEKATVKAKTFWLFYNWHGTMVANRGLESLTFKGFLPFHSLLSWNIKLLPSDAKANQGTSRKNQIKVFWGLKKKRHPGFPTALQSNH